MWIFTELDIYHDPILRPATMNMAIDEALLEMVKIPSIRFYGWRAPSLSFGYFGKFSDVAAYVPQRDLVRRWTGGGIVFHGDDLTYSIVIPANYPVLCKSSVSIYEKIHRALGNALIANGAPAELEKNATVTDRRDSDQCFASPVQTDVLVNGRKVAGAAQRRTRGGLLHQGSIQHVDLGNGLAERFATELCAACREKLLDEALLGRAREIAAQKYGTDAWLRKR